MSRVFTVKDQERFLRLIGPLLEQVVCQRFLAIEIDSPLDVTPLVFILETTNDDDWSIKAVAILAIQYINHGFFSDPWDSFIFRDKVWKP